LNSTILLATFLYYSTLSEICDNTAVSLALVFSILFLCFTFFNVKIGLYKGGVLVNVFTDIEQWFLPLLVLIFFLLLFGLFHWLFLRIVKVVTNKLPLYADNDIANAFDKPARVIIIVLGFFLMLKLSPLFSITENIIVIKGVHTCVIFCIFWIAYNLSTSTNSLFIHLLNKMGFKVYASISNMLSAFFHTILVVLGAAMIISEWGYDINGFIAGLSLGGLAISLAAKDTLSNIFAGMIILADKPFSVGDWVITNNIEGSIEQIAFRSTSIRTIEQALVYIPNSLLTNTPIINYTKRNKRRIDITIGVVYQTTQAQLHESVQKAKESLSKNDDICDDDILVVFNQMNNSSLDIRIICYSHFTDYTSYIYAKEKVNFDILGILEEVGTSAAFPSTSVYIENND